MNRRNHIISWLSLLVVLSAAVGLFAINTQAVLQWAFAQLSSGLSTSRNSDKSDTNIEVLQIGQIQGRLFGPIELDELKFETPDITLRAARVNIVWQAASLLYGNIHIVSLVVSDVDIRLPEKSTGNTTISDNVETYIADLDKMLSFFPFDINSAVFRNIRVHQAQADKAVLIEELKFSGRARSDNLYVDNLQVISSDYTVSLAGIISAKADVMLDAVAQWRPEATTQAVQGKLKLQGNTSKLTVSAILDQPSDFEFDGVLEDPVGKIKWSGRLTLKGFNFAPYLSSTLDTNPLYLDGTANVSGDLESVQMKGLFETSVPEIGDIVSQVDLRLTENNLDINQATISQAGATANVSIQGNLSLTNEAWVFNGQSQWRELQWPLSGAADLSLPAGEIAGRISATAYDVLISNTTVQYKDHDLENVSASIKGNEHGLKISELHTTHYEATITGAASIDWQSVFSWDASLQGSNINPGNFNEQWPGSISAVLNGKGSYQDNILDMKVQLDNSAGTLRGKPFKGHAAVHIIGDKYSFKGIDLVLGETVLSATGSVGKTWDLSWDIAQADLALFLSGSGGKLNSKGRITGRFQQPLIIGQLHASNVDIDGQYNVDLLTAHINIDVSGKKKSDFVLAAKNLHFLDYQVDKFELKSNGIQANHQIDIMAKFENDTVKLSLRGDLEDEEDLRWVGKLEKGNLQTDLAGAWRLVSDAPLKISENSLQFEQSCWSRRQARWCADTRWQKGESLDTHINFNDVPLSLFQALFSEQFVISGLLNGAVEIHAADQQISNAKANLRIDKLALQMKVDEELKRVTSVQTGVLNYQQTASNISGNVALQFSDKGSLSAAIDLSSPGNTMIAIEDWPIEANLEARSQHPDFIRLFYAAIGDISGTWRSDIKVRGTLNKPNITGSSIISGPSITIPDAGLTLRDVELGIRSVADNNFKITGGLSSGNGSIKVDGRIIADPSLDWPIELTVRGERMQVLNLGKSIVDVSPDLHLKKSAERIDISGSVEISKANIVADAGLSGSVKMSNDVIFVDEQASAQELVKREKSPLAVFSNVELILSDDVHFNGYGLSGRLVGSVNVQGEPGKATTGQGAFHIRDGRYKAYGITLDLDIGRLIFENNPVDNPAINARASSRSGDITAGFRITGYLTEPEINVYSIPSMPDSEALSYLLFGKKVDDTSFGRDSFDGLTDTNNNTDGINLGDALNPNGYIDYVVGMFNSSSVLRVRFELNKNWELYTESSINRRGAEIVYTFEK